MTAPQRPAVLDRFLHALHGAARHGAREDAAIGAAVQRMLSAALDARRARPASVQALHPPVCAHLDAAFTLARGGPAAVAELATAFEPLARQLAWQPSPRARSDDPAFRDGHANTQILGPQGLELRSDVVVGASLLAPGVSYPLHDHPPEEIYVVLSPGEWFRPEAGWYTPGPGGVVHHAPGLSHAMRAAQQQPLLAIWTLWTAN